MPLQEFKEHWQHCQARDLSFCVKGTVEFIQLYPTLLPEPLQISPSNYCIQL